MTSRLSLQIFCNRVTVVTMLKNNSKFGCFHRPEVVSYYSTVSESKAVAPRPKIPATSVSSDQLQYDKITHTGQAWDAEDIRLARFTFTEKQVNPNIAMHLIAEVPPIPCKGRIASCDGGGGLLGHPKIYINLDKPGNHACGYCGLRFYLEGQHHDGSEHIQA